MESQWEFAAVGMEEMAAPWLILSLSFSYIVRTE